MKIAMWSGPRNLSTALMYSFGARDDFDVMDEPFYGAYLATTDVDHPMGDEIIASMETDPHAVARGLATHAAPHIYVKHMTHHMIDGFPRTWFADTRHAFLIRHPVRVIASYAAKREAPLLEDIGFVQQCEIFEQVRQAGLDPVVVDSFDIRADPKTTLKKLCAALGLAWSPAMLSWEKGGHPNDGVWASHWYGAAHRSSGFAGPEAELPLLEPQMQSVADAAMPYYQAMAVHKI